MINSKKRKVKKILLASALILSIAGIAQAPIYAEESNANPPATTEQSNSKENKKDLSTKTEEEVATLPKDRTKEEAPKKEGWQEENKQWRFYENNQPVLKWKKIQDKWYYFDQEGNRLSGTILTKREIDSVIPSLMAMFSIKTGSW